MRLIDFVVLVSKYVPELPISSSSSSSIKRIFPFVSEYRYSSASFFISLFASLLLSFVFAAAAFQISPTQSIPVFLLSFALLFYLCLSLPKFELQREISEVERELPFFLRELSILLELGIPFNTALASAAGNKGKLTENILFILSDIAAGSSFQKALSRVARESGSNQFKRVSSALISAYEHGGTAGGLAQLSRELLLMQRYALKDASSRLALFGILFIVFSALGPTFLLLYFSLGRMIFSVEVPEYVFLAGMLVLFPAISLLILVLAKSFVPASSDDSGFKLNPFAFYNSQKKKEDIEKFLPDALISISAVPAGASTEAALLAVAKGGYGQLSEEFEISLTQLRSKVSLDKVLADLSKRNNFLLLSRAAHLLSHIFTTNHFSAAATLAGDFLADSEIKRERASIFSIHKYTLFFGAILIPLILSIMVSLTSSVSGILGATQAKEIIFPVVQVYLAMYCAMVSYFSAYAEGKKSLLLVYFPLLLALSLITFHVLNFIQS